MMSLRKLLNWPEAAAPPEEAVAVPTDGNRHDLPDALLHALQMLLEGLPLDRGESEGSSRRAMAELARRLKEPLLPFDVLEIAGDALAVLEQDANTAQTHHRMREEQLNAADKQVDLSRALMQALETILGGLPLPDDGARRSMAELQRRLEQPLLPFDVLEIAGDALSVVEQAAKAGRERDRQQEEQRQLADRQGELAKAAVEALHTLLAGLPFRSDGAGRPDLANRGAVAMLLNRLEGPLAPADLADVVHQALAVLVRDMEAARDREDVREEPQPSAGQQDALSKALLEAMQMLLGNWPLPAEPDSRTKHVLAGLLRRLEQPLAPFDVLEIASDAVAAMEQDAKAALDRQVKDRQQFADQQSDFAQASLQALRMVLGGLPFQGDAAGEPAARSKHPGAELLRRLEGPLAPFDILEIANEALTMLEQDTKAALNRYRLQNEELQAMISMLTETVAGLSVQKTASVTRLQQVERRIEQASQVEDLRTLKSNLAECLQAVREASANQLKQSAETIQAFERQIQNSKARLAAGPKAEPEKAFPPEGEKSELKSTEYTAVFLLDRETSIASRFGEDVRQKVLRFVQQHLKESLMASDRVIRWKGAAFLASMKRVGSIQDVRAELTSVASISAPQSVDVGNRSIRLPISLSWAAFSQARFASLDLLFEKVDDFIARAQGAK